MPAATEAPTLMLSVDDDPAETEAGPKPDVTPLGAPASDSPIDSALPETSAVETDVEPEPPATIESEFGVAAIEKSFGGGGTAPVRLSESKVAVLDFVAVCEVTASPASRAPLTPNDVADPGMGVHVAPSGEVDAVTTGPVLSTRR